MNILICHTRDRYVAHVLDYEFWVPRELFHQWLEAKYVFWWRALWKNEKEIFMDMVEFWRVVHKKSYNGATTERAAIA